MADTYEPLAFSIETGGTGDKTQISINGVPTSNVTGLSFSVETGGFARLDLQCLAVPAHLEGLAEVHIHIAEDPAAE